MKWDDLILIRFQSLPLPDIDMLFTYAAMETEVNTDPIVDYLHFRNPAMQVAYPVCEFEHYTMQAVLVTPTRRLSKINMVRPNRKLKPLQLFRLRPSTWLLYPCCALISWATGWDTARAFMTSFWNR
ncbi:hypothetical protein LWM68_25875 [Niabella sp. W65]|nr:hypothetical protein [Niabella sp. W65]MCH7365893.1 hypothetical protein [Niabella sp. W65]